MGTDVAEDGGDRRAEESEPRIELDMSVTSEMSKDARLECFSNLSECVCIKLH